MNLSIWAFQNKKLIYFLIGVLILGGVWSAYDMSKLEDPEIKVKIALIATTYPGASAHEVELEVTDPLEKSIRSMGELDHVESYSYNDLSIIQVELQSTVSEDRIEQKWDELRRKVFDVSLPESAGKPIVKDDFGNVFGMFYALTGDGYTSDELNTYSEFIKRELLAIEGVDRVDLYGKRDECINITLLEERMSTLGVMPIEVLTTLNNQNAVTYSGYFLNGGTRVRVSVSDRFKTVEDISSMLIQGHEDDQITLKDIATVELAEEDPIRNQLTYDGKNAVGILVAARSGTDITKIGKVISEKMDEIQNDRLPAGVACNTVFYQPERVSDALNTFVVNLIESVVIVVVFLMFFMGFKSGLIIGTSLLLIVLGSFLFLKGMDGTMQRVSLAAFILAMGMLVDNAIVIVDGILIDIKAGKPRMNALTDISKKTAMPLLGATLIAILAFLPIYLSPDTTGLYVRDLFIVLGVSLLLSWVLAIFHVPLMSDRYLKAKPAGDSSSEAYTGKVYDFLERTLEWGLKNRITFVVIMLVLLAASGIGYGFMKQGFFPDMVYDQLYMEYKLPEGYDIEKVDNDLTEIQEYLMKRPEVRHVTASLGGTPGRYNLVRSIATPSLSYGELIIDFTSPDALVDNIEEIQQDLSSLYPEAYVKLKRYNLMYKKYPIEAVISGPDPAVLNSITDSIMHLIKDIPDLDFVTTDWEPKVPMLNVEYDQKAARAIGISRSDISMSMLEATGGIPISAFYSGIDKQTVYVKTAGVGGSKMEDMDNIQVSSFVPNIGSALTQDFLIKLGTGNISKEDVIDAVIGTIPLKSVTKDVSIQWEDPVVPRFNGERSQRVQCSPAFGKETERSRKKLENAINAQIHMPEGYSLSWQGEKAASDSSMKYLFNSYPMAIVLIIAILIMLFKDYKKPLIILLCLPMVLCGVVITMLISGKTFGFVAIVGVLGLIGMLIKNGIVLMDEINLEIEEGIPPHKALINGSKSRLRAVMMAAMTTVLGMIPLLPDAMFGSLAATIMGGLTFATIIILLFVPVLYSMFFHIKKEEK